MVESQKASAAPGDGRRQVQEGQRRGKRDTLAHTGPLIMLWLPMLLVVGLMILTGATTSHYALAGALVALLLMTFAVVNGTVQLANRPPESEQEDDEQRQPAPVENPPKATPAH